MPAGHYQRQHQDCAGGCGRSVAVRVNVDPTCRWCRERKQPPQPRVYATRAAMSIGHHRLLRLEPVPGDPEEVRLIVGYPSPGRWRAKELRPVGAIHLPTKKLPELHRLIGRFLPAGT